ncbi:MAG: DUF2065 domain-containing protein [Chromatiales bacterium]|jgi:uncharacterized protein YjeT (DUF2065 family)|nr:DUF2065 domain-containing protein [Chromatiales bacterium]MDX9768279.1 DUF2065 domain-containing protein [Ectothiorhodospiraceae bacterium]
MWNDLLAALALLLVIEGILPFLNPGGFRQTLAQIAQMPERLLRQIGLASMILGALLLYWVRG